MVAFSLPSRKPYSLFPMLPQRPYLGSKKYGTTVQETIIGKRDRRRAVSEATDTFPWSIHGHLEIVYGNKVFVGSGLMVNFCHVLSAGHCLYAKKDGGIPDHVTFYPGRHGPYAPWVSAAKNIIVDPSYHKNEDTDSDLGMIILEENEIGEETGWARLKIFDDNHLLEGLNIDITGYPADKFVGIQPYMYTMKGPIKVVHHNRFYYDVDTSPGQSGSGVCTTDAAGGDIIDCLGIHTTGSKVEGNGATRINKEKLDKIGKWVTSFFEKSCST